MCMYMYAHVCMCTCVEGGGQMGTGSSVALGGLAGSVWSSSEYISNHAPLPREPGLAPPLQGALCEANEALDSSRTGINMTKDAEDKGQRGL